MLKIEKLSKANFTVRLREKDPFFSREMTIGIGLALFFHLIMMGFFSVKSFHFDSVYVFPPVEVQLEEPIHAYSFTIHEGENEKIPLYDLELIDSKELIQHQFLRYASLVNEIVPDFDLLESIEKRVWPIWIPPLNNQKNKLSFEFTISGEIAHYSYQLNRKVEALLTLTNPLRVNFDVKVDSETGKIFWYDSAQLIPKEISIYLEKIMRELVFNVDHESIILNGQINFNLFPQNLEANYD